MPIALGLDGWDFADDDDDGRDDIVIPFVSPRVQSIRSVFVPVVQVEEEHIRRDLSHLTVWLRDCLLNRLHPTRSIRMILHITTPLEEGEEDVYDLLWLLLTHARTRSGPYTIRLEVFDNNDPPPVLGRLLSMLPETASEVTLALLFDDPAPLDTVGRWLNAGVPLQALRLNDDEDGRLLSVNGSRDAGVMEHLLPHLVSLRISPEMKLGQSLHAPFLESLAIEAGCDARLRFDLLHTVSSQRLRHLRCSLPLAEVGVWVVYISQLATLQSRCPRLAWLTVELSCDCDDDEQFRMQLLSDAVAAYKLASDLWRAKGGDIGLWLKGINMMRCSILVNDTSGSALLADAIGFCVDIGNVTAHDVRHATRILRSRRDDWHLSKSSMLRLDSMESPVPAEGSAAIAEWLCVLLSRCDAPHMTEVSLDKGYAYLEDIAVSLPITLAKRRKHLPGLNAIDLAYRAFNFNLESLSAKERQHLRTSALRMAAIRMRYQFGMNGETGGGVYYDFATDSLIDTATTYMSELPSEVQSMNTHEAFPIIWQDGLPERAVARL